MHPDESENEFYNIYIQSCGRGSQKHLYIVIFLHINTFSSNSPHMLSNLGSLFSSLLSADTPTTSRKRLTVFFEDISLGRFLLSLFISSVKEIVALNYGTMFSYHILPMILLLYNIPDTYTYLFYGSGL